EAHRQRRTQVGPVSFMWVWVAGPAFPQRWSGPLPVNLSALQLRGRQFPAYTSERPPPDAPQEVHQAAAAPRSTSSGWVRGPKLLGLPNVQVELPAHLPGHRALVDTWNALVPEANARGIPADRRRPGQYFSTKAEGWTRCAR